MHDGHQPQHEQPARARAGQVDTIDKAEAAWLDDEAQADEQPGQREIRQQDGVIQPDIAELLRHGGGILQLQRIERVPGGQPIATGRRRHQRGRQPGQQHPGMTGEPVARQGDRHAAEREPGQHDGNDPVAILRPFRDGEIAGQRDLEPHRPQRHEEQRGERGTGSGLHAVGAVSQGHTR
jgi:hypothetical protein